MKITLFAAREISLPLVLASCLVCTAADEPAASAPPQPVSVTSVAGSAVVRDAVNWPEFMAGHDLVWTATPKQWNEGGFIGNGMLGIMAYATLDDNRFDFHIGRADVTDHRGAPDRKTSFGMPGRGGMADFPRLDPGRMALRPAGKIQAVTMRQDLWNAELRGTIQTDLGKLEFRALTQRDEMIHLIDVTSTEANADGSPAPWKWEFLPGNPDSPFYQLWPERSPNYERNPLPVLKEIDGIPVVEQRLLAGGDYATAWKEVAVDGRKARLFLTTAYEMPTAGSSVPAAVETIRRNLATDIEKQINSHRAWWHDFYRRSFINIPDSRLESFYMIQLYKFAAATRKDGPIVDLAGPWFRLNQWPAVWWNLNVQLQYWLPVMANHPDLAATLPDEMDRYWQPMLEWLGNDKNRGDLAWALHNYWLHYRYAGDWESLSTRWLPKALQMLEKYRVMIEPGADGRLHLKPMVSPEYKHFATFKNTNYNLALVRWLAASLKTVSDRTGAAAAQAAEWSDIAARLVDPPVDQNGLMIGSEQSFDSSHRHFSHIIGFYPLYVMDADDPATHELLTRSIEHWLNFRNPDGFWDLCGFSLTIAASKYASLGDGDKALPQLQRLLDNWLVKEGAHYGSEVLPNGFTVESQGKNPTIETALSGASATIELLLQSWGEKVRVFPAVPSAWKQASFHQLRAEGGFLVSAERKDGRTAWVAIESQTGDPLVLKVADWQEAVVAQAPREIAVRSLGSGEFAIDLKKGECILLSRAAAPVSEAVVTAMPRAETERNPYGVRPDNQLKNYQSWPQDKPLRLNQP